jgi:hypothetical protein
MAGTYSKKWRALAIAALLLPGVVGCGAKLYPVHGQVTISDGKVLTEGMVVFESKDAEKAVMSRGEISTDGSYNLGTLKPGDGAYPGKYRVLVAPKSDPNAIDKPGKAPPFDPSYSAFATSGLEFEVTAGPNDFPIKVSKQKKTP